MKNISIFILLTMLSLTTFGGTDSLPVTKDYSRLWLAYYDLYKDINLDVIEADKDWFYGGFDRVFSSALYDGLGEEYARNYGGPNSKKFQKIEEKLSPEDRKIVRDLRIELKKAYHNIFFEALEKYKYTGGRKEIRKYMLEHAISSHPGAFKRAGFSKISIKGLIIFSKALTPMTFSLLKGTKRVDYLLKNMPIALIYLESIANKVQKPLH